MHARPCGVGTGIYMLLYTRYTYIPFVYMCEYQGLYGKRLVPVYNVLIGLTESSVAHNVDTLRHR